MKQILKFEIKNKILKTQCPFKKEYLKIGSRLCQKCEWFVWYKKKEGIVLCRHVNNEKEFN